MFFVILQSKTYREWLPGASCLTAARCVFLCPAENRREQWLSYVVDGIEYILIVYLSIAFMTCSFSYVEPYIEHMIDEIVEMLEVVVVSRFWISLVFTSCAIEDVAQVLQLFLQQSSCSTESIGKEVLITIFCELYLYCCTIQHCLLMLII